VPTARRCGCWTDYERGTDSDRDSIDLGFSVRRFGWRVFRLTKGFARESQKLVLVGCQIALQEELYLLEKLFIRHLKHSSFVRAGCWLLARQPISLRNFTSFWWRWREIIPDDPVPPLCPGLRTAESTVCYGGGKWRISHRWFQDPHPKQQEDRARETRNLRVILRISLAPMSTPTSSKPGLAGDPGCQSS
jgi:hypothetical protein